MRRKANIMTVAGLVAASLTNLSCVSDKDSDLVSEEFLQLEARVMDHQSLVAECMQAAGFDYVVALPNDVILERMSEEADAKGETLNLETIELPEDPNEVILQSMSNAEVEAYLLEYWGDTDTGGSQEGCYHSTFKGAWGADPYLDTTEDFGFDVEEAVLADQRVIAARDTYLECMASNGFRVTGPNAILDDVEVARQEAQDSGSEEALEIFEDWRVALLDTGFNVCHPAYGAVEDAVREEIMANGVSG